MKCLRSKKRKNGPIYNTPFRVDITFKIHVAVDLKILRDPRQEYRSWLVYF
jgi:hypothetical protein